VHNYAHKNLGCSSKGVVVDLVPKPLAKAMIHMVYRKVESVLPLLIFSRTGKN